MTRMNFIGDGECGAVFSSCRRYRYSLWRRWSKAVCVADPDSDLVAFIGVNPSTADETTNDPTVTRCINFAKRWGCGGMVMLNLFAFRATDPRVMKQFVSPIGPLNDQAIDFVTSRVGMTVCCWGNHGLYLNRGFSVRLNLNRRRLHYLGMTKEKCPKHPLYLAADTVLQKF